MTFRSIASNFVLFAAIMTLASCATVSNEVSLKKMLPGERLYTGYIKVKMTGQENPKCELYLNYDLAPSIKIAPDGFIVYKTDRQKIKFRKIACYHEYSQRLAAWHLQDLNLTAILKPDSNTDVMYFGDINLDWQIEPESTREAAEKESESATPLKVGRVNESGEIRVKIADGSSVMQSQFFEKVPAAKEKGFGIKTSLLELSKE